MSEQLEMALGVRAKEEGMAAVESTALTEACVDAARGLVGQEVTGEDIRNAVEDSGVEAHHPNAWGASINRLVRLGILQDTGRTTRMRRTSSHARRTPIYRIVL